MIILGLSNTDSIIFFDIKTILNPILKHLCLIVLRKKVDPLKVQKYKEIQKVQKVHFAIRAQQGYRYTVFPFP